MGSASSSHDDQKVHEFPPPKYSDLLWMCSCRPTVSMSRFSKHTLLYQPDTRMFCLEGLGHSDHFIHTTRDAFRAAVAKDKEENPATTVVNDADTKIKIPFITQCWSLNGRLSPAVETPLPYRRTVVVWVHGFRQRYHPVVNMCNHLLQLFGVEARDAPVVMAFLWPSYLNVLQYKNARANANEARPRFIALLEMLHERQCSVVVVGHSMGCRVALHSLLRDDVADASQENCDLCKHLMLIAAAVEANALSVNGEFPRNRLRASQISVISSHRDDVLQKRFPQGENVFGSVTGMSQVPVALGFSGPIVPIPVGVTHINATNNLPSHSPHAAIMLRDVQKNLFGAVGLQPLDEEIASSFDDELRSNIDGYDESIQTDCEEEEEDYEGLLAA